MQYSPLRGFAASLREFHCDLMTTITISAKMTSRPISSMFIAGRQWGGQQGLPAWQPLSIHSEMTPAASLAITLRAIEVGSRPALVLA